MRKLFLTVLSAALLATAARAGDEIPSATLTAIKAATVFVKVDAAGLAASGSGFVIKTDGDSAYIVTNNHVVQPEETEVVIVPGPRRMSPFRSRGRMGGYVPPMTSEPTYTARLMTRTFKNVAVTAVFQSGTTHEESLRGEILAADPELDLAVVKVNGVKKLPKPIDIIHQPTLSETMPIYTFGFPFGKVLATSKGSPAITVGKGSISSLRMDDDGNLALVQIDGALNPGNSGGPVVDAHGRLVGIAVATIRDSTGIGLAIPCRELIQVLRGRPGKVYLHTTREADGGATVHVEVGLIDPLKRIKAAELHYVASKLLAEKPKPGDPLEPLPGCRKLSLKIENQVATGEFTLKSGFTEVPIYRQAVCITTTGKQTLGKSVEDTIRVRPVAVVVSAPGGGNNPSFGGRHSSTGTQILGGGVDPQFKDGGPGNCTLVGFEAGLGKWADNDVITAVRPIFLNAQGSEVLGQQHGADTSHVVRVKAKQGYAVGAVTAKAMAVVDGFSVTFMRVDKDRLDPKDSYESDWVGGKGGGSETRLGGDGRRVVGLLGKANSKDCTGLGLEMDAARPNRSPSTPPHGFAGGAPGNTQSEGEFSPGNGLFTIKMPAGVAFPERRPLTLRGHRVTTEGTRRTLPNGARYEVVSMEIPASIVPANQRFGALRDALVKHLNGEVVDEGDIQSESLSGKRYQIERQGRTARVQMYTLGDWAWYTMIEGRTKDETTAKEADAFNSSLHLTEKGKLAAGKAAHGS